MFTVSRHFWPNAWQEGGAEQRQSFVRQEKLVLEQKIVRSRHPILRWNMANIFIRTDPAGNVKADKTKSTEKIDGACSFPMFLHSRCAVYPHLLIGIICN